MMELEKPEDLAREVSRFTEQYLSDKLNEADQNGENPLVMIYSLINCMQVQCTKHTETRDEAVADFQALIDGYIADWKKAPHSTQH